MSTAVVELACGPTYLGIVVSQRRSRLSPDSERRARVALSFLAQPGDPVMGRALSTCSAAELLALVTGADADGEAVLVCQPEDDGLSRALPRWRDRLVEVPSVGRLAACEQSGLRLVPPGDAEWPAQLDDLGDARPLLLWVRGTADLRFSCLNSVSMVGSRAASGYGNHVALDMAATLAEHGVCVISDGAKTINSQGARTKSRLR
jgi:DNA processing protein